MTDKRSEYVQSALQLAKRMRISRAALNENWLNREGNPGKTPKGYHVPGWDVFREAELAKKDGTPAHMGTDNASLNELRAKRTRLYEIEIAEKEGKLVPLADHKAEITTLCQIFLRYTEQVVSSVSAITRDPKLVKRVKELIRHTRIRLADELDKGTPG